MHDRHGLAESLTDRESIVPTIYRRTSSVTTLTATSQQPPESPGAGAPSTSVVVVARSCRNCRASFRPGKKLAEARASSATSSMKHWMLLPALQAYGAGEDIGVALVLTERRWKAGSARDPSPVCFPVRLIPRFRKPQHQRAKPVAAPRTATCVRRSSAPIAPFECVSADCSSGCVAAPTRKLLELPWISADGPFPDAGCWKRCNGLGLNELDHGELYARPVAGRQPMRPAAREAARLGSAGGGDCARQEKAPRRKRGRLEQRGNCAPGDDIRRWIEEFLRVEASGWKGRERQRRSPARESGQRYFTQDRDRSVPQRALADARPGLRG